ncbi:MAG: hypothetical protein Q7J79_10935 [Gemmatimonadales bacterium]|nr:hypothetical protein [Gemmatimonadales bacterium]
MTSSISMDDGHDTDLERQGHLVKRLRADARRWVMRGVLLLVAGISFLRWGGTLFVTLGVAFVLLAVLTVLLARQNVLGARGLAAKLELLRSGTTPHSPLPK